jgi:hypothetical protein
MFENRIEEQVRQLLLGHLNALWDYGWRSVLLSEQFATFPLLRHRIYNNAEAHAGYIKRILCSNSSGINGDCRVNSTALTRNSFSICVAHKLCTVLDVCSV